MTQDTTRNSEGLAVLRTIDDKDIKFLAAGEKINDIETAIRELVENSIDAGSKNIEVRLTKFGVDTIEVDDNGCGIDEDNFDKLAIRYHTSKIKDYKSFQESLETFGFRGEALSCLCNIANVTIITKTKSAPTGSKLIYKKDGTFTKSAAARDNGTTVILKNLFHSMPVRRRELELNGKKQYDRVVKLLYEQALARPHIKFSLCRKTGSRKEKDFTHGGTTLEGCLITIFGIKIMETLMAIRQPGSGPKPTSLELANLKIDTGIPSKEQCNQDNEQNLSSQTSPMDAKDNDDNSQEANNRNSSDSKDLGADDATCPTGSVRELNSTQADPTNNVIFSQEPSKFYKRRSTNSKYARERIQYFIHGYISKLGCGRNSTDCQFIFVNKKPCDIPKLSRLINEIYRSYNQNQQSPFYCLFVSVQNFATDFNVPRKRAVILQDESKLCDLVREYLEEMYATSRPASQKSCPVAQIPFASQANAKTIPTEINNRDSRQPEADKTGEEPSVQASAQGTDTSRTSPDLIMGLRLDDVADSIPDLYESAPKRARKTATPDMRPMQHHNHNTSNKSMPGFTNGYDLYKEQVGASSGATDQDDTGHPSPLDPLNANRLPVRQEKSPEKRRASVAPPLAPPCKFQQDELMQDGQIKVYINNLQDLDAALECDRIDRLPQQDTREFSFAIHPNFNAPAEDQLKLHLNKTSFREMQVIGQFNCGFILTKLNKHIFIIDQHASDERANFEEQLGLSPMVKQRMANAQPLYFNLIQENAILNNMEAFRKHGFEFLVDTTKTVGFRVIQSSTSISRESGRTECLRKEDIEELVDVAIESPARLETYTLKKVSNLAASIACRKSVMVGDKLTWQRMSQIVERMSNLKNPWVCAHNRPTIRHLMDTDWKVFGN